MHGTCIKIIEVQQAKICNNNKNTRPNLLKTNASIWFNKILSVIFYKLIVIVLLLVILQNNKKFALYMYWNKKNTITYFTQKRIGLKAKSEMSIINIF